jgi:hypothetical protein
MHDLELQILPAHPVKALLPSPRASMHSAAVTGYRPAYEWLSWVSLALACLLALQACNASPDEPRAERGPRSRPINAEARAHLDRGNRLFRIHELDQAIEAYKAGILLEDAPLFHFNLGQSFRKAGQYEKALWHFELFARHVQTDDPDRPIIEAIIAKTKAQRLSPPQAPLASPLAATASADAKIAAETVVVADAAESPSKPSPPPSNARTLDPSASSARRAAPQGSRAPFGELTVMVTPWAAVWLNGKSLAGGTPSRTKVPAGRHRLRIANEDLRRQETLIVTIKPNETTTVERMW